MYKILNILASFMFQFPLRLSTLSTFIVQISMPSSTDVPNLAHGAAAFIAAVLFPTSSILRLSSC